MATLLRYADDLRQANPYAAPQTREMILPLAMEATELRATRTDEIIPVSTRRWMQAARAVYLFSFAVPMITTDMVLPFAGGIMFLIGAVLCWHPFAFPWWANVLVVLSQRNLHCGRSQRGLIYATLAVLASASWMLVDVFYFQSVSLKSPPYFCWLAAMILQWVAAVDMRGFNKPYRR